MSDAFDFWNREIAAPTHVPWMGHPEIRAYINESVSGSIHGWPFDWFQQTYPGVSFDRGLSIGCGSGPLERPLIERGLCRRIDAFDGSVGSLAVARQEADRQHLAGLNYYAANFNDPLLPASYYDIAFFHQSLHHVAKLEKLMRAVRRTLKPGGMLYLDEYIGPSRHQWNDATFAIYRELYRTEIPREWRLYDELPLPIQEDDPSEAIRSGEIIEQLEVGFDIEHFRPVGGNIISVIYPALRTEILPPEFIRSMIDFEKKWLREERQKHPFYAVIVARPKQGAAGALADARWFAEPKLKRIGREIGRVAGF